MGQVQRFRQIKSKDLEAQGRASLARPSFASTVNISELIILSPRA